MAAFSGWESGTAARAPWIWSLKCKGLLSHMCLTQCQATKLPPKHSGTGDVMFSPAPNHFWPWTHFLFCNEMAQECHSSDTSEAERGPRRKSSCALRVWDSDTDLFEQWWLDSHVSKSLMSTYYTLIHIFRPHSLTLFDLLSWNASGDRGV